MRPFSGDEDPPPVEGSSAILRREHLDNDLFLAAGLSWGAALIHVQASIGHLDEYVPYAVLFAALAATQFAWGLAICRRPLPRLLWTGCALSVAVALVWLTSRTTGLPIGPEPWSPEPMGAADAIASTDEIVLALLVVWHLRFGESPPGPGSLRAVISIAGVALISLSSLTFMFGPAH